MLSITNTDVYGWEAAIRGMRNPKNSWSRSDSYWTHVGDDWWTLETAKYEFFAGDNDLDLMSRLASAGTEHGKFLRMINVTLDIDAPLFWWKEFDTYKVGTVADSCSTMHKIHAKKFEVSDFSHEHLMTDSYGLLEEIVELLNEARNLYLETNDKNYWWQMIEMLPSSYNQKRTVQLNYAVLRSMYHQRKNHKLDDWHIFCAWIEDLPYAKELLIN